MRKEIYQYNDIPLPRKDAPKLTRRQVLNAIKFTVSMGVGTALGIKIGHMMSSTEIEALKTTVEGHTEQLKNQERAIVNQQLVNLYQQKQLEGKPNK